MSTYQSATRFTQVYDLLTEPAAADGTLSGHCALPLTLERKKNYVPYSFYTKGHAMVRAVVAEALALASLTLFLGMVAIWAQVLGVL